MEVLTPQDLAYLDSAIPRALRVAGVVAVEDSGLLTAEIMSEGPPATMQYQSVEKIRFWHHRAAQLLVSGIKEITVARMTGMAPSTIANLKASPAFQELLAHYKAEVDDQWTDFVARAADLSQEVLDELAERMRTNPDAFTVNQLLETLKTTADRSGNAPVARSLNVNANVDLGARLAEARKRSMEVEIARLLPSEDAA